MKLVFTITPSLFSLSLLSPFPPSLLPLSLPTSIPAFSPPCFPLSRPSHYIALAPTSSQSGENLPTLNPPQLLLQQSHSSAGSFQSLQEAEGSPRVSSTDNKDAKNGNFGQCFCSLSISFSPPSLLQFSPLPHFPFSPFPSYLSPFLPPSFLSPLPSLSDDTHQSPVLLVQSILLYPSAFPP